MKPALQVTDEAVSYVCAQTSGKEDKYANMHKANLQYIEIMGIKMMTCKQMTIPFAAFHERAPKRRRRPGSRRHERQ